MTIQSLVKGHIYSTTDAWKWLDGRVCSDHKLDPALKYGRLEIDSNNIMRVFGTKKDKPSYFICERSCNQVSFSMMLNVKGVEIKMFTFCRCVLFVHDL